MKMQKDIDSSNAVLKQILVKTQMLRLSQASNSKKGNESKEKVNEKQLDQFIAEIYRLNQQFISNKDKIAEYCVADIQRKRPESLKQIQSTAINVHELQHINTQQQCKDSQYVCKINKKQGSYNYLRIKQHLYIFNHAFLPQSNTQQNVQLTYILTQCKMEFVISYVQLCVAINKITKIIMPTQLWAKFQKVMIIFFRSQFISLLNEHNLRLFAEQKISSFDFQHSTLIFNKTLWVFDSYNVFISMKGTKIQIKGVGLNDEQQIYTAWRKDIISEEQYCKLIDKTYKNNISWSTQSKQKYYAIKSQCDYFIKSNVSKYVNFCKCQLFLLLNQSIIHQLFQCGEIIQYQQNQIIYKQLTLLDKFYVVLKGSLKVVKQKNKTTLHPQSFGQSDFFSSLSFTQQIQTQYVTLIANSKIVQIFSIPLWKIKFILGTYLQEIIQVQNIQLQQNFVKLFGQDICLSERILKIIKMDQIKCQKFSSHTTKLIGKQKTKVSKKMWKQMCDKDLRILYNTFQSKS